MVGGVVVVVVEAFPGDICLIVQLLPQLFKSSLHSRATVLPFYTFLSIDF